MFKQNLINSKLSSLDDGQISSIQLHLPFNMIAKRVNQEIGDSDDFIIFVFSHNQQSWIKTFRYH